MQKFIRTINKINESMVWVVGILLFLLGIFLFYSVIMRYFFNKPPVWAFDLSGWFTGLAAFLAGGYTLLKNAHVRIDIFYDKFSPRMQSFVNILATVCLFLIVIVLFWRGMQQVITNYQTGTIANTGLNIYIWIKWLMVPLGSLLLGLQAIVNLINDIYMIVKGEKLYEEESS